MKEVEYDPVDNSLSEDVESGRLWLVVHHGGAQDSSYARVQLHTLGVMSSWRRGLALNDCFWTGPRGSQSLKVEHVRITSLLAARREGVFGRDLTNTVLFGAGGKQQTPEEGPTWSSPSSIRSRRHDIGGFTSRSSNTRSVTGVAPPQRWWHGCRRKEEKGD